MVQDLRDWEQLAAQTEAAARSGEVLSIISLTVNPSITAVVLVTPTAGARIRVVSVQMENINVTVSNGQVYFGTGADILTDPALAIAVMMLDQVDLPIGNVVWPDRGGPVGAVDQVISWRFSTEISGDGVILMHYREE